jgi:AraC family transcriptional regulator of adaptative response/methylated-DNA-[protein]-cysteine methyltransferase
MITKDEGFFYSVKTTGVYCRPSCPSRRPKPENVAFHATASDAERAGFRACKRCKPDQLSMANETEIRFAVGECSLGSILVAATDRGVCAILLGEDPDALARDLQDRFPKTHLIAGDSAFEKLVATVVGLIEAPSRGLNLPLDVRGTAFQQRVWQALRSIPPGKTASYTEIAKRIGLPKSVRAVAQACGANALAVAIPCHRVVRNDGALSGYRWGVERKRALLQREATA